MIRTICFTLFLSMSGFVNAQIWNGTDTLYANEWIDFDLDYYKILVANDGVFRISKQALEDEGIPMNAIEGSRFELIYMGEPVPIFVSTDGILGTSDFIEFCGSKNRSELDRHLFKNPDLEILNPNYSLFTDSSAYFLTWLPQGTPTNRVEIQDNVLNNLPPKEASYLREDILLFTEDFHKEIASNNDVDSQFGMSEGFGQAFTSQQDLSIQPTQIHLAATELNLQLRLTTGQSSHHLMIKANGNDLVEEQFTGYQVKQYEFDLPVSGANPTISLSIEGLNGNFDSHAISNIISSYPANFDFENQNVFQFKMPASQDVKYLEIENFASDGFAPILYDKTNSTRLIGTLENDIVKIALPPSTLERELILVNPSAGIQGINNLQEMQFINYADEDAEFIILSNPNLYNDPNTGTNWVQEYADYRSSSVGGDFKTIIVDAQQLYDQFGYGINRHSLAVRNFGHFIKKNWANPEYLFLLGKAREYRDTRTASQLADAGNASFHLPTFGWPGADNLLMADNYSIVPIIPLGRLAAESANDVRIYLEKVKSFESNQNLPQTIADKAWMKRIIHLGGGIANSEQSTIRNRLVAMSNIIENSQFGAEVFSFYKNSTDPIQISQSEGINDLINDGLSIITFFGHSSPNTFDFNLDNPENYQNKDRYPFVFSLGCYSGRIHENFRSISENFVLAEEKGAIGFFASVGQGFLSDLNVFGQSFYFKIGDEMYGNTVGNIFQSIIDEKSQFAPQTRLHLLQQMIYHGDPALRFNPHPGPDFVVERSSVAFNPMAVNIQQENFELAFSILNIGQNNKDSIEIEITQQLPNNSKIEVARSKISTKTYRTELTFQIPTLGTESIGLNRFFIKIDPADEIEELPDPAAELNNELANSMGELGIELYIFSSDVLPVYPSNYAIVSEGGLTLKASTANIFAPQQRYFFEIDTTQLFNSALHVSTQMEQSGGILKWTPNISYLDNTVYYWRVSQDSTNLGGFQWRNSSFIYLEDSPNGWNQSHFYQFKEDKLVNLILPENRRFQYIEDVKDVKIKNGVFPSFQPSLFVNNQEAQSYLLGTINAGLYIAVFDTLVAEPWINPPGGAFGSYNIFPIPMKTFPFKTNNTQEREKAINFLRDSIPAGYYVGLFTIQQSWTDYEPEEWESDVSTLGTDLFQILEEQGATLIRNTAMAGAKPYVFFYQKDRPDFDGLKEELGTLEGELEVSLGVPGLWHSGDIETKTVGPASNWARLIWNSNEFEPNSDIQGVDVFGVKSNGLETLIHENLQTQDTSLTHINAAEFPFLRLKYHTEDEPFRTTPQLDFWRVLYDGLPEAALDPATLFSFYQDTLQRGEPGQLRLVVENIGDYAMDSLLVKYKITDLQNNDHIWTNRLAPLSQNDTLIATTTINTRALHGAQQMLIEINPDNDQPEQFHFNNIGLLDFFVEDDKRNPLLDVTFDGVHIMNRDIVAPRPNIVISLLDENKYLELADTGLFKILLAYPDELTFNQIPFDSDWLTFFPASLQGKNRATVEFNPDLPEDGIYTLLVQAKDVTGNQSGAVDYKIQFEVITKVAVSNVLNYPNPFSTSTRFVYTITGEVPAYLKIRIMTVSGRVVREITQDEIGPLRVGTHRTEFAWDGTDEFGDRLANGIYLYQVVTKNANGEQYNSYDTGTDAYFKKGIGKMVILR